MIKGHTFLTGESCSAASLNELVDSGTLSPTDITAWTAKTTTVAADRALIADSEATNALKSVTLGNLVPAGSITPAKLASTGYFVAEAWRVQAAGAHGWNWMPGGSSNLILQETTSAGAALTPTAKIPIQIFEGTLSNTLYLNATGIGVYTTSPAEALDVNGNVRSSGVIYSRAITPRVGFFDVSYPTAYQGIMAFDGNDGNLYIGAAAYTAWNLDKYPVVINTRATDGTLVLSATGDIGIGTGTPAYKLDVVGSVHASGSLYLDEGTAPASAAATGTKGEIRWNASTGYLYVCVATNTWKRAQLTTW